MDSVIFEEEQSFRHPWILALILTWCGAITLLVGYMVYEQLILGRPVGDNPMPDAMLLVFAPFMLLLAFGLPFLFYTMKLKVRVDTQNLSIAFSPFTKRTIPLDQVAGWEVRQYRPLREYGGWGVRFSLAGNGMAYNVSGNVGVQLKLADGKQLLIGSRKAGELAQAIGQAKSKE